jgi:hypothetical protein
MKWESLKRRVADEVGASVLRRANYGGVDAGELISALVFDSMAERRPVAESTEALLALCEERVMQWDIRCAGRLRELFPWAWPRSMARGRLLVEIDESGDWQITVYKELA